MYSEGLKEIEATVNGIKFSLCEPKQNHGNYRITSKLMVNGSLLCYFTAGEFNSCACASMEGFNAGYDMPYTFWKEPKNIDALIMFLNEYGGKVNGWNAKEVVFLLGAGQSYMSGLIAHKNVQNRDSFTNKAHSGNAVRFYRLSLGGDFATPNQ